MKRPHSPEDRRVRAAKEHVRQRRQALAPHPDRRAEEGREPLRLQGKDVAAIIIALLQLLLPWLIGGGAVFFLLIFLLTRCTC